MTAVMTQPEANPTAVENYRDLLRQQASGTEVSTSDWHAAAWKVGMTVEAHEDSQHRAAWRRECVSRMEQGQVEDHGVQKLRDERKQLVEDASEKRELLIQEHEEVVRRHKAALAALDQPVADFDAANSLKIEADRQRKVAGQQAISQLRDSADPAIDQRISELVHDLGGIEESNRARRKHLQRNSGPSKEEIEQRISKLTVTINDEGAAPLSQEKARKKLADANRQLDALPSTESDSVIEENEIRRQQINEEIKELEASKMQWHNFKIA